MGAVLRMVFKPKIYARARRSSVLVWAFLRFLVSFWLSLVYRKNCVLPVSGPWLEAGAEFRGCCSAAFSMWSISYSWRSPASMAWAAPASSASSRACSAS